MKLGEAGYFFVRKWLQSGEITLNFCRNQRNNGFSALKTPKNLTKRVYRGIIKRMSEINPQARGALRRRQVKFILSAVKSRRALTGVLILDRTDDGEILLPQRVLGGERRNAAGV